jgi:hypothetical protein
MKRALTLALLSLSTAAAMDGGGKWTDTTITSITANAPAQGYVLLTLASSSTGTPSCASGEPRNVVIPMTPGGKEAVGIAESAMMTGKTVTVTGMGTCSVVSTAETLLSIQMTANH